MRVRSRGTRIVLRRLGNLSYLLLALASASPLHAAASASDLRVVSEDKNGIVLEYRLPEVHADAAPGGLVLLRVEGCALPAEAGVPAVPSRPLLLALPPGARPVIEILESTVEETDAYPVSPTPEPRDGDLVFGDWKPDLPPGFCPSDWAEASPPTHLRAHRVAGIRLNPIRFDRETGKTRILTTARVHVRFVTDDPKTSVDPEQQQDADPFDGVYRRALLNYASGAAWKIPPAPLAKDAPSGDSFRSSPDWIRIEIHERGVYRITTGDLMGNGILDPHSAIGDPRGIRVYSGAAQPLPLDLSSPRPEWMEQVAIRVSGEEDGSFDPEDAIEFYALPASGWKGEFDPDAQEYYEHVDHPYSDHNVYWLTWGGAFEEGPRRIARVNAGPAAAAPDARALTTFLDRVHAEEDLIRDLTRYGEDGWFWTKFFPSEDHGVFYLRTFDADTTKDGSVRMRFFHYADALNNCGTERARLQVNGVPSAQLEWNSCRLVNGALAPFDYDSTAHWVADGTNSFDIQVAFRKKVYLCWIEMGYRRFFRARDGVLAFRLGEPGDFRVSLAGFSPNASRVFDTTDPHAVKEVIGISAAGDSIVLNLSLDRPRAFYAIADTLIRRPASLERVAVRDLRGTGSGAEYMILTADELAGAAGTLAAARSREYSTTVVRLSDVYANFSWGLPDPVAIRDFLAFAYRYGPEERRPAYVLLLGDATTDFRDRLGSANMNTLPALFRVDKGGSRTNSYSTDDFFAYLDPDSGASDWAPDLAIGRLPAQNADEASRMVSKIVAYGGVGDRGPWQSRLLFLADDERRASAFGGYDCGFLLSHTADAEELARIAPDDFERGRTYLVEYPLGGRGTKPEATDEYIRRMNEGFLLSAYVGHGGFDQLADEGLLAIRDVVGERIEETPRRHFFTAWSCAVGGFDLLDRDCLAEALLKEAGRGSIGSVAASQDVFAFSNQTLACAFTEDLLGGGRGRVPVGLALAAAKAASSAGGPGQVINNEKYILLSDPALRLAAPGLTVRLAGLDTLTIRRGTPGEIQGEVLDETGERAAWFDGTCALAIRATADTSGYTFLDSVCNGSPGNPDARHVDYALLGPLFFEGDVEVEEGRFRASFFPPLDARVGPFGRAGAYVLSSDGATDGFGGSDSIPVAAEPDGFDPADHDGPRLRVQVNERPLREGAWVRKDSRFVLEMEDVSGIYQSDRDEFWRAGVILDHNTAVDLGSWFHLDRNSYQKGAARFRFDELPGLEIADGEHEIIFHVTDNLRNRTDFVTRLTFVPEIPNLVFREDVLNFPNPFDPDREETEFFVDLSRDANVTIQVFTLTGRRIRVIEGCRAFGATRLAECRWDGRDEDGDRVANGVYLIRAFAETPDGSEKAESIGKALVMRGR